MLGASVAEDKLKTAPRLSIVVLPFENITGDKEQDYFADEHAETFRHAAPRRG
jgi:TolB-like protein